MDMMKRYTPLSLTYSPILSATAPSSPLSCTISLRTSAQSIYRPDPRQDILSGYQRVGLTLSILSTADEIVRILSSGTPQTAKIPSKIFLWLSCSHLRSLLVHLPIAGRAYLYCELDIQRGEDFAGNGQDLSVWQHGVCWSRDIEILSSRSTINECTRLGRRASLTHW